MTTKTETEPFGPVETTTEPSEIESVECPRCNGTGLFPTGEPAYGDDPERPCELCAGVGLLPVGYADEYVNVLWKARQRIIAQNLRIQQLRGRAEHFEEKWTELLQKVSLRREG